MRACEEWGVFSFLFLFLFIIVHKFHRLLLLSFYKCVCFVANDEFIVVDFVAGLVDNALVPLVEKCVAGSINHGEASWI